MLCLLFRRKANAISPIARFAMQMGNSHDNDRIAVQTVDDTIRKPCEKPAPQTGFYFSLIEEKL